MSNISFSGRTVHQASTSFQKVDSGLLAVSDIHVCDWVVRLTILVFRSARTETKSTGFELLGTKACFPTAGTGLPKAAAIQGRAKMTLKNRIVLLL